MRLASLLALVLLAAAPRAQTFTVVSSAPADHAVSVPLATTLRLTFSARVADPAASAAPAIVIQPDAEIGAPVRSADGLSITLPLALAPSTRYVVLVLGAEAEAGGGLTAPFALNLTTGATNGPFTVRGTVSGAAGVSPQGSIVALVTGNLATGDIQIVAADVVEAANGMYVLGPVPFGLYTAGAIRLPLPLGTTAEGFGYGLYDPDGDGTPNPIFGTTGANITLAPPPPRTAAEDFAGTLAAAEDALGPFPTFLAVDPSIVGMDGTAAGWSYRFGSQSVPGDETRILRVGLFTLPVPVAAGAPGPGLVTFFFDSPEALAATDASGGSAFRAAHAAETVTVTLESVPFNLWRATYRASGGDELALDTPFAVDLAAEPSADGSALRLALRSANPTRGAVTVALRLDAPQDVRVAVLDVRGRTVARLVEGPLAAGEVQVTWAPAASIAAGVYRVVAEAGGRRTALAVTVVR